MSRYAEGTPVSPDDSQREINRTLRKYGCDGFGYGWEDNRAVVTFRVGERLVRFSLTLPLPGDEEFRWTPARRQRRTPAATREAYEAEVRRRWRALVLAIKAKLEVVETGIATFEEEFLAHLVLPDGSTVGGRVVAEVDKAWAAGVAPPRLLAITDGDAGAPR